MGEHFSEISISNFLIRTYILEYSIRKVDQDDQKYDSEQSNIEKWHNLGKNQTKIKPNNERRHREIDNIEINSWRTRLSLTFFPQCQKHHNNTGGKRDRRNDIKRL